MRAEMMVIPAVDLRAGQVVRLAEGDPTRMTVYGDDPLAVLDRFAAAGARRIHVVNLDGAFTRSAAIDPKAAPNDAIPGLLRELVARAHALDLEIEIGGGLRSAAAIEAMLAAGADLVIVGTLAIEAPAVVAALCRRHPGRIIVAVDARDGVVATEGWREASDRRATDLGQEAAAWGAAALLYTDIARDGLQGGPNIAATAALQATVPIPVIASGGVGSLADLAELRDAGIRAVVVGRALYEGAFTLEEALGRC